MPPKEGGENEWHGGQGGREGGGELKRLTGERQRASALAAGTRGGREEVDCRETDECSFFTPVDENGTTNTDKSLEG